MRRDKKQIKRVLLINPFQIISEGYDVETVLNNGYYAESPLGLAYIVAMTEKEKKYVVDLYDAHIEAIKYVFKEKKGDLQTLFGLVENKIKEFNPDIIRISCMFHITYKMTHKICEITKKFNKEIITVMGGSYLNTSFKEALSDKNLDYILLSEVEISFPKLINYLNNGNDVSNNDGIVFVRDGKLIHQVKTVEKSLIDDAVTEMQKAKSITMEDEENKSYFTHFKIDLDAEINKIIVERTY